MSEVRGFRGLRFGFGAGSVRDVIKVYGLWGLRVPHRDKIKLAHEKDLSTEAPSWTSQRPKSPNVITDDP